MEREDEHSHLYFIYVYGNERHDVIIICSILKKYLFQFCALFI